jgi:hypothetical protein
MLPEARRFPLGAPPKAAQGSQAEKEVVEAQDHPVPPSAGSGP